MTFQYQTTSHEIDDSILFIHLQKCSLELRRSDFRKLKHRVIGFGIQTVNLFVKYYFVFKFVINNASDKTTSLKMDRKNISMNRTLQITNINHSPKFIRIYIFVF